MEQTNTMTEQTEYATTETEEAAEARLAQINALMAAKQMASDEFVEPKAKLAPFTCPMDPAERAACDSCQ